MLPDRGNSNKFVGMTFWKVSKPITSATRLLVFIATIVAILLVCKPAVELGRGDGNGAGWNAVSLLRFTVLSQINPSQFVVNFWLVSRVLKELIFTYLASVLIDFIEDKFSEVLIPPVQKCFQHT